MPRRGRRPRLVATIAAAAKDPVIAQAMATPPGVPARALAIRHDGRLSGLRRSRSVDPIDYETAMTTPGSQAGRSVVCHHRIKFEYSPTLADSGGGVETDCHVSRAQFARPPSEGHRRDRSRSNYRCPVCEASKRNRFREVVSQGQPHPVNPSLPPELIPGVGQPPPTTIRRSPCPTTPPPMA